MNRVVVPRDSRIAAADVRRRLPAVQRIHRQARWFAAADGGPVELDAAAQDAAIALPEQAQLILEAGDHAEHRALVVGRQVAGFHAQGKGAQASQLAHHADAVFQVHQAEGREGKIRLGKQFHLQGESQYVRIGGGQASIVGEAT